MARHTNHGAIRRGFKGQRKSGRHAPSSGVTSLLKAGRRRKLW